MSAIFKDVIGQKDLTDEIGFYLDSYKATKMFPNSLMIAERGGGKTELSEAIGKKLKKPYHEMLAKDLSDTDVFMEYVYQPLLAGGKPATLFIDEASLLSPNITHFFLKILDTRKGNVTRYQWGKNGACVFDFTKVTFLFATTNPQMIDPDLKDRLKLFTFDQYTVPELAEILQRRTPGLLYEGSVLNKLAETLRNNPRNAVLRAEDILGYVKRRSINKLKESDFSFLQKKLNIMPLGLNKLEIQALSFVAERPKTSLTTLAAKMHMTSAAVRQDIETRLLSTNLIEIDARGRKITTGGLKVLLEAANLKKQK